LTAIAIRWPLEPAGIEFIAENRGRARVRLKKSAPRETLTDKQWR
jgi:hypothetical protein